MYPMLKILMSRHRNDATKRSITVTWSTYNPKLREYRDISVVAPSVNHAKFAQLNTVEASLTLVSLMNLRIRTRDRTRLAAITGRATNPPSLRFSFQNF